MNHKRNLRLDSAKGLNEHLFMIELEIYAAGIRNPDKIMGLTLELDSVPGLRYKVDTNHDIVYMEFTQQALPLHDLKSIFRKLNLDVKFVGTLPPEMRPKAKTTLIQG